MLCTCMLRQLILPPESAFLSLCDAGLVFAGRWAIEEWRLASPVLVVVDEHPNFTCPSGE